MRTEVTAGQMEHWFGADGVTRLPEHLLPPTDLLPHGPSRRFLTAIGLPADLADLELGLHHDDALPPVTGGLPNTAPGARRLLVLGEPAYHGSHVVLDGETGQVHLASWGRAVDGMPALDPIASDLSTLVHLMLETERVWRAATSPELLGGRRGPAAVEAVNRLAEERMRAVDPEVFPEGGTPAHWNTAVLIRSMRWVAMPGGEGGPAFEITPELVADLGEPYRYAEADLPAGLTHAPTRRLLTEVGVPRDNEVFSSSEEELVTFAERSPERFEQAGEEAGEGDGGDAVGGAAEPAGSTGADADAGTGTDPAVLRQRDFYLVGHWIHDLHVLLDGATGRLEVPADSFDGKSYDGESYDGTPLAPYLNRDLSALLCTCWILQRLREERERWDYGRAGETWRAFDVHSLLLSRMEDLMDHVDPHALEHPGGPWRTTVDDPYTGGPLG
ncbi:SUKH-4 family immunity protein [Streptomyces sp. NPDC059506]|uniref:SUKH-4 family immunity protein n=1 Tax=Streptomyces sp. NPDC059506 TaxID=3347751 RepID=UPI0036AEF505